MKAEGFSRYFDNRISYNHLRYIHPDWNEVIPQIHNAFEILFVIKGSLIYTTNKRTYYVSENSIILTRSGAYHRLNLNDCDTYERYNILFDESIIMPSCLAKLPEELDILVPKNPAFFLSLFQKFDFYCEVFTDAELSRLISNLVEEIFFNIVHLSANPENHIYNTAFSAPPLLVAVTEYIEKNISAAFSVESLCREFYISKSYLLKLFRDHLHLSPQQYMLSRRMIRAQNLLRSGKKPTELFTACGFSDYSTFYRSYKRFWGYAPSDEIHTQKMHKIDH